MCCFLDDKNDLHIHIDKENLIEEECILRELSTKNNLNNGLTYEEKKMKLKQNFCKC